MRLRGTTKTIFLHSNGSHVVFWIKFPDMPCMKRVHRDKASVHWSAARKKERDKPRINRLSTGNFVPAFGLHRISPVCAFGEAFRRHVFDALEGTKDSCGRNVLLACSPARPRPAALPCAPTRPACGILGHALHEKGLQRQKGVGSTGQQPETKSASRSGDKPRINRLSTGDR